MKQLLRSVLVCLLLAASPALGCKWLEEQPQQVSSSLDISITHLGLPVSGIRVEVIPSSVVPPFDDAQKEPVIAELTDTNGILHIQQLPPGKYTVLASERGISASALIEVVTDTGTTTRKELKIMWGEPAIQTRRVVVALSTRLVTDDESEPARMMAFPSVRMKLQSAFAGGEYQAFGDSTGLFVFPQVPEGIYVLQIPGNTHEPGGTIADSALVVEVTPHAERDVLPLQLYPRGCDWEHPSFRLAVSRKSH